MKLIEHFITKILKKFSYILFNKDKSILEQRDILDTIRKSGFEIYDLSKSILAQKAILEAIKKDGFEFLNLSRYILDQNNFINIIEKNGYEIFKKKEAHHYVPNYYGHSAHKRIDIRTIEGFGSLATQVIQNRRTLLYYDRLYIIYQSLKNIRNNFGTEIQLNLAEVGVYKGGTSWFISHVAKHLGFSSKILHCFDTFKGHMPEDITQDDDSERHPPFFFGNIEFSDVQNYLSELNGIVIHIGRFQDTSREINNLQFHFVHLDVDLYEPTLYGLKFFNEHLIGNGIIIVDDYGVKSCPGVEKAIDEFLSIHKDYFVLQPLTEQLIFDKIMKYSLMIKEA